MKRLTLLTILLVVVGLTAGFAIDVKPTFSLSGSATAKWGVDLITGDHGFNNTADASFTLNLFPADGTESKGAKDAWYGSISFANLEFYWTDSGVPVFGPADADITAKIVGMGGDLSIGIYAAPSLTYAYAGFVPLYSADAGYATTGAVTPLVTIKGGLSVAYTLKGIGTLTAKVASIGDWGVTAPVDAVADTWIYVPYVAVAGDTCATLGDYKDPVTGANIPVGPLTPNVLYLKLTLVPGSDAVPGSGNDQYALGADFSLSAVKDLTFAAGVIYDLDTSYLGFGVNAGYTIAGITASVGFDGVSDGGFSYDLAGSVAYKFMEAKDSVSVNVYNDSADSLDVGLLFSDAEGFVKGLAFSFGAYVYDLLADPANDPMLLSFGETASYKFMMGEVNYVKPYETVRYDLADAQMYLNVGVETKLIANTTFKIDFVGGATANDNNVGLVGTDLADYQVLSVSATVTY